jgi:S1/P1 Nuclease
VLRHSRVILIALALASAPAEAWGDLGHRVTALIAYRHLTPKARTALDALLKSDGDTLTPQDFAGRATWADKFRIAHRETAAWHFINIEIDHPDVAGACFDFPAQGIAQLASAGPAEDCVVNKIDEFAAELRSPLTAPAERLLALKFLIHFIGDVHQPLHAADHGDRGGNCIGLASARGQAANLHGFWDVDVVEALGHSPGHIADKLDAGLTPGPRVRRGVGRWSHSRSRDAMRTRCRLSRPADTAVSWRCRPTMKLAPKKMPPRNCSRRPCASRPCSMRRWDRHEIS